MDRLIRQRQEKKSERLDPDQLKLFNISVADAPAEIVGLAAISIDQSLLMLPRNGLVFVERTWHGRCEDWLFQKYSVSCKATQTIWQCGRQNIAHLFLIFEGLIVVLYHQGVVLDELGKTVN